MSKNLVTLTLSALDDIGRLTELKQVLELCLEQFDNPTEYTQTRVELLISFCLTQLDLHLDELKNHLEVMRSLVSGQHSWEDSGG